MKNFKNAALATTIMVPTLALTGCQQYLTRTDYLSAHTGDAVAANISNQTVDPWARHVHNRDIETSAERQANVRRNYQSQGEKSAAATPAPIVINPPRTH